MDAPADRPVIEVQEYAWRENQESRMAAPTALHGAGLNSPDRSVPSVVRKRLWIAICATTLMVFMCAAITLLARPRRAPQPPVAAAPAAPAPASPTNPPVVEATPQKPALQVPKARVEEGKPASGDRMLRGESSAEEESSADGALESEAQQSPGKHARSHR